MRVQTQRKAFSLLTAIFVILIMASVGALVMSLSGKMVKETTAQYQREQAMLLAQSYTEFTVMSVMANNRTNNCLKKINGTANGFDVKVKIAYIGSNVEVDNCGIATNQFVFATINSTKSPLSVIIDVYVSYKDFDHHDSNNTPWIKYHKRTLQKI